MLTEEKKERKKTFISRFATKMMNGIKLLFIVIKIQQCRAERTNTEHPFFPLNSLVGVRVWKMLESWIHIKNTDNLTSLNREKIKRKSQKGKLLGDTDVFCLYIFFCSQKDLR